MPDESIGVLAHGHTVVTRERREDNAKARVLIPNACDGVGVEYVDPYAMLRAEGVRFVL